MQSVIVLFALLACAFADLQSWQFSGTTNTSLSTAIPASLSDTETCVSSADGASQYENVTITITTAGGYFIYGMFQVGTVDTAFVNVYSTYTPATPCTGIIAIAASTSGGAPHLYLPLTLSVGTYTFVITTSNAENAGIWSLHINQADFSGNTNGGNNWWVVPDSEDEDAVTFSTCANSSEIAPYVYYNWTQPTTGLFDINIFFGNITIDDPEFVAMLYNTSQPWVGTGSAVNPANPCANAAGFYLGIVNDDDIARVTEGFGTAGVFPSILLTAGTVYTIVVSGTDDSEIGPFGGRISPTVYYQIGLVNNYAAVSPTTDPSDCVSESTGATLKVWRSFVFTAQWPTYVVDNGPSDIGFDTIAELYIGNNAGIPYSTPPAPCTGYLECVDTGDVGPLSATGLIIGANYTIVVTTYGDEIPTTPYFTLWAFTGNTTGSTPIYSSGTTVNIATSNTATSAHVTSNTATSANSATSVHVTSANTATSVNSGTSSKSTGSNTGTSAGSTTGSAQTIAASFFLSLLGVAFALQF